VKPLKGFTLPTMNRQGRVSRMIVLNPFANASTEGSSDTMGDETSGTA